MGKNEHTLIRGQKADYLRKILEDMGVINMCEFIEVAVMEYRRDLISEELIK